MKRAIIAATVLVVSVAAQADTFGTGANQFDIEFVTISGETDPASAIDIGGGFLFSGVDHDYRMGVLEISNGQWDRFKVSLGTPVTGDPSNAYARNSEYAGGNVPATCVSWYEAAQFVNWLNTSTGHQAAYKLIGTQGTSGYTLTTWTNAEAEAGTKLFRHKDAFYFLPTEDEWVKAAYWNGGTVQTYATKEGESVHKGDGVSGTGWNYQGAYGRPWPVGSGSEELNGTHDMMGNVWEWMENPHDVSDDAIDSRRTMRGGSFWLDLTNNMGSYDRDHDYPFREGDPLGFRVAAVVPGPSPPPDADFNDDGHVDVDDIALLCANMGGSPVIYDMDADGDVDEDDLVYLVEHLIELQDGSGRAGTKRGDFNLDGLVNGTDLAIMKTWFGTWPRQWVHGNANCDDIVDATDLAILKSSFGFTPPTGQAVPEPATLLVMAAAGLPLLLKRKRKSQA